MQDLDPITAALTAGSEILADPLPGVDAQLLMSPRPRRGWRPDHFPAGCRQAAVLLLVYPIDETPHVVLTQRRADLPDHPGQVSLPGGEMEPGETHVAAALREAEEEVGLVPDTVSILGRLTPLHIPVSNFVLHPVVGRVAHPPQLRPADVEVARILVAPVAHLADRTRQHVRLAATAEPPREVPYFAIDGLEVWGATAMILAEFLTILGAPPDPWRKRTAPRDG